MAVRDKDSIQRSKDEAAKEKEALGKKGVFRKAEEEDIAKAMGTEPDGSAGGLYDDEAPDSDLEEEEWGHQSPEVARQLAYHRGELTSMEGAPAGCHTKEDIEAVKAKLAALPKKSSIENLELAERIANSKTKACRQHGKVKDKQTTRLKAAEQKVKDYQKGRGVKVKELEEAHKESLRSANADYDIFDRKAAEALQLIQSEMAQEVEAYNVKTDKLNKSLEKLALKPTDMAAAQAASATGAGGRMVPLMVTPGTAVVSSVDLTRDVMESHYLRHLNLAQYGLPQQVLTQIMYDLTNSTQALLAMKQHIAPAPPPLPKVRTL